MALDSVQPVPCVPRVCTGSPRKTSGSSAPGRRSTSVAHSSPARWPPFTRTAPVVVRAMTRAARVMDARPSAAASMPESALASGMLGVTTWASGKSSATTLEAAPCSMSAAPLVATMTGSTTTWAAPWRRSPSATARTIWPLDSMPTFTAAGAISSNTASIWSDTNCGVASWIERTPQVFWAVSAVIALWP